DTTFVADDFWQGALSGCSASPANQFGIPINLGFSMILYDNNAFVEAGITPPPLDWGWHEFLTTAEGLAQKQAGETVRYGFVNTQSSGLFFYPLLANDTTNQLETTVDEYINLHTAGTVPVPDAAKLAWEQQVDMETLVLQRQAAMWTDWQGFQNGRQFSLGSEADIQMLPFPAIDNFTNTTPVSILLCGGISAGTTNPQASWEWLQFLSTHLNHDEYGRIPARQSLAESSLLWQPQIQPDTPLGYALRHAYYAPVMFDKTAADTLITQVIVGELTVEELLIDLEIGPPVVEAVSQATPLPMATAAPSPSQETVVIRYFADFRTHGDATRVQRLADQFNASQNRVQITVNSNVRAASSFGLETVAAQYDCFSWEPLTGNDSVHVYNLEPLLASETAVSLPINQYDPRLLNQFRDSGILYAIPASSIPTVIALNVTYLEQIGAKLPDEAWMSDDFWTFAQDAATEADGQPVYGFTTLQGEEGSIGLLSADGSVQPFTFTDDILTVSYDTPEIAAALNQLVSLASRQAIFPAYDIGSQSLHRDNWDRRQQLIATGQVAMWTTIAGLEEEVSFDRILFPLPQGITNFSPPISTGYYISQRLENPSACWEWLTFLAGQETAVIGVPARASIAQSATWKNSVGNREAAVYTTSLTRQLNSAKTLNELQLTAPLQSWWNDLLAAAYGGENMAALLSEAQRKGEIYAACLNVTVTKDTETVTNCAREADPAYKTFQELAQELNGG
ncbi:MAG: carbohydrate ABC transporter substrate-binding protein, partial [Anaerolineales bacterium]|nr:carbohydrate ABC transporter substrate-binding protein [Anaerolineales bacterium]